MTADPDASPSRITTARAVARRYSASLAHSMLELPRRADPRPHARPTFLIVGAQRCGTTSLFRALAAHPAVCGPGRAHEVHYFDVNYGRSQSWYEDHFPAVATVRAIEERVGERVQVGESSPYYMFHPLAPGRLAAALPRVKLLVLLRDPVGRAISAHGHEVRHGFEREPLERALALEPERVAGERERLAKDPNARSFAWQHYAYMTRGRYSEQLRVLFDKVGRDNVLVLDSHDLFNDSADGLGRVLEFLGLSRPPSLELGRHNAGTPVDVPEALVRRLRADLSDDDARLVDLLGWTPAWLRTKSVLP